MYSVYVFLFGALGGSARYSIHLALPVYSFPWATLMINLLGCLLIGITSACGERFSARLRVLVSGFAVGFIGALTTFSTFIMETIRLIQNDHFLLAALYICSSSILGFGLVFFGFWLVKAYNRRNKHAY